MAKQIKAHINRQAPGDYEYLTTIAFEHDQSDCLRITRIRMRKPGEPKAFKLPLSMLTWYTEHAPAGREITRDDNNQQNNALLYIELKNLKEQIGAFSLKDHLYLEIEIKELDRDDVALTRNDDGKIKIEVNLYAGPRAGCTLTISPLQNEGDAPPTYPPHLGKGGRFDLAELVIKSKEGPLDPRTDKRVILADIKLAGPYKSLRPELLSRLRLFQGRNLKPNHYVRDRHSYDEQYKSHPMDQNMPFPNGARIFGPLMPQGPREKQPPLTLALMARLNDPFWKILQKLEQDNHNQPLTGTLELILPEPDANKIEKHDFKIELHEGNWLIIEDGNAKSQPVYISLNEHQKTGEASITLPQIFEGPPASAFISLLYYQGRALTNQTNEPMNLALSPAASNPTHIFKPDVLEISQGTGHLILLNPTPDGLKKPAKSASFNVKCFWPETSRQLETKLTITWTRPINAQSFAIDIGAKSIAMAKMKPEGIKPLTLAACTASENTPTDNQACLQAPYLPANVQLITGTQNDKSSETTINSESRRAAAYPLSLTYDLASDPMNAAESRLVETGHTYDINLPAACPQTNGMEGQKGTKATTPALIDLKPLITTGVAGDELAEDTYYLTRQPARNSEKGTSLALTGTINPQLLLADALHELISFYGTYLPTINHGKRLSVEDKAIAQTLPDEPTMLVLTHPDSLTETGKRRYLEAGAKALSLYEQGSFQKLGPAAELVSLQARSDAETSIHLISETTAAAYRALQQLAEKEQPARARKIAQIHMNMGHQSLSLGAFQGWIGETAARLDEHLGSINLPLGETTAEAMLAKEVAKIMETALNAGAPLMAEAPLPGSKETIKATENPVNEELLIQQNFIRELRCAILGLSDQPKNIKNDFKLILTKSTGTHWPYTLSSAIPLDNAPLTLWQGLNEQKLVLTTDENKTHWQLELHASIAAMCEKVGPLSTYLAFIADFLPRAISTALPLHDPAIDFVFSLSGGAGLFKALQNRLAQTADHVPFRLIDLPETYEAAKHCVVEGALHLVSQQRTPPLSQIKPNIIVLPRKDQGAAGEDLEKLAQNSDIDLITSHQVEGDIPKATTHLQVIETITGLAPLIKKDKGALSCHPYLEDLDRAAKHEWANAESLWSNWLQHCSQTMLNMAIPDNITANGNSGGAAIWRYQTLQENEAQFTIGDHTYWVSSGLIMPDQ